MYRLNTLEKFLRNNGFVREANTCFGLVRVAAPLWPGPDGEKKYIKPIPARSEDPVSAGFLYVLKTEPPAGSDAPFGWYVGETVAPIARWVEHNFGLKSGDGGYLIKNPSEITEGIKESVLSGAIFTGENKVLEMVCAELVAPEFWTNVVTDDRTKHRVLGAYLRKKREKEVTRALAEYVGSENIGGDMLHMSWIRGQNFTAKSESESEIKNYIKTIVDCTNGADMVEKLNNLRFEDFTEEDNRLMDVRRRSLDRISQARRRRSREEREEVAARLDEMAKMSPLEREAYRDGVIRVAEKHRRIRSSNVMGVSAAMGLYEKTVEAIFKYLDINHEEVFREAFARNLKGSGTWVELAERYGITQGVPPRWVRELGFSPKDLGANLKEQEGFEEEQKRLEIIDALKESVTLRGTARRFGLNSSSKLHGWLKKYDIPWRDFLGANLKEQERFKVEQKRFEIIDALKESKTIEEAARRFGLSRRGLGRRIEKYDIPWRDFVGANLKEQLKEQERLKGERKRLEIIDALKESATLRETARRLLVTPASMQRRLKKYDIPWRDFVGANLKE